MLCSVLLQATEAPIAEDGPSAPGPTAQQDCSKSVPEAKENSDSLNQHPPEAGTLTEEKPLAAPLRNRLSLKKRMRVS